MFLASPPVKMLLLAGMDRLDTALTVGQMQGKFQLTCMPQSGHAIHEDQPLKGTIFLEPFSKNIYGYFSGSKYRHIYYSSQAGHPKPKFHSCSSCPRSRRTRTFNVIKLVFLQ